MLVSEPAIRYVNAINIALGPAGPGVLNKGFSDGKRDLGSDFKQQRHDDGYEQRDCPGADRHQPIADRNSDRDPGMDTTGPWRHRT